MATSSSKVQRHITTAADNHPSVPPYTPAARRWLQNTWRQQVSAVARAGSSPGLGAGQACRHKLLCSTSAPRPHAADAHTERAL